MIKMSNTESVFYDLDVDRTDVEKEELVNDIAILYYFGVNVSFLPAKSTIANKLALFLLEKTNGWFSV